MPVAPAALSLVGGAALLRVRVSQCVLVGWGWGGELGVSLCELFVRPKRAAAGGLCCAGVALNGGRWPGSRPREAPLPLKGGGWWRRWWWWRGREGGHAGSEPPVCPLLAPSMGKTPCAAQIYRPPVTTETAGRRIPPSGPEGAGGTVGWDHHHHHPRPPTPHHRPLIDTQSP